MAREGYSAIDVDEDRAEFSPDHGVVQAVRWPREPGLFASMNSPAAVPASGKEWWAFVSTTRGKPIFHAFAANFKAGATVACVNLALSISLGIASGGTPTQGMLCGVWSSVVMGVLGSSHFNVVGTTSALAGMLDKLAIKYGTAVLPTVSLYASLFLVLLCLVRADRGMRFIATPVAHGFSVGVAIMIGLGQLSSAFAIRGLPRTDGFLNKLVQFGLNIGSARPWDTLLYLSSAVVLFTLVRRFKAVPWVLFLALGGIALGKVAAAAEPETAASPPSLYLLREQYPEIAMGLRAPGTVLPTWVPVLGSDPGAVHCTPAARGKHGRRNTQKCLPAGPEAWQYAPDVIFYSFGCAVVGLLETLISGRIALRLLRGASDDFDLLSRTFSTIRESAALALSALACAFAGGVAPAAALARTSLNVQSGAFSRVAGLVQVLLLSLVAFVVLPWFEYLPFAVVGSILLLVAFRLVDFAELAEIRRGDPAGMYLCILTAVVCLCMDTFAGLIVGTLASLAMNRSNFRTSVVESRIEAHRFVPDGVHAQVRVKAPLTFANVDEAAAALEDVIIHIIDAGDRYYSVHLDLSACDELDFDAAEALDEWARKVSLTGTKLTVDCGVRLSRILQITHHLQVKPEVKPDFVPPATSTSVQRKARSASNSGKSESKP